MMLAAMLAMVLAVAAPAFAQTAIDNSADNSTDTQYTDSFNTTTFCNQVGGLILVNQAQYGDATATATDDSAAAASIAQELGVSQDQVLNCFVGLDGNGDGVVDVADTTDGGDTAAEAGDTAAAATGEEGAAAESGSAAAATGGVLPDTGGASLITLGAGALLVAGGLVARKIVR